MTPQSNKSIHTLTYRRTKLALLLTLFLLSFYSEIGISDNKAFAGIFSSKGQNIDDFDLFKSVVRRVQRDYVQEVSEKELIEYALNGMLTSLDPHSAYYDKKAFEELKMLTHGQFGGLGIEVTMENGLIKVISPYEGGPAHKHGIMTGDYITMIDGQIVKGMSISEAVDKLRGRAGTMVSVSVYRESSGDNFELTIRREIVKIIPVKAKLVGDNDIIHIKLSNTFNESTVSTVKKEYYRLYQDAAKTYEKKIQGIVLDLRSNPGGLLDQALEVTELFMPQGDIVITKGRIPDANRIYKASGADITNGLPLIVLINGGSASASEIVAGALQDNKRALIVGTKSFGKGSVQNVIGLPNGTGIKLTTSRYYTPTGRGIQAEGIIPDIIVEDAKLEFLEKRTSGEASLKGHLSKEPGASADNQSQLSQGYEKNIQDFQLLRAVDLIKGLRLYGNFRRTGGRDEN